jgi:serine/threonine-protein kinase
MVISQYPGKGSKLRAKQTVSVTVSLGPEPVAVPRLATLDLAQAAAALSEVGLRLGTVTRRTSLTVPDGAVITWAPKVGRLLPRSRVAVVVSAGKPWMTIPSPSAGVALAQYQGELTGMGFTLRPAQYYYNDTVPSGVVLTTAPPPGTTLVFGSPVTVDVSMGPHLVRIPSSVLGVPGYEAAKLLEQIGIGVYQTQGSPLAAVTSTQPAVGTQVLYGKSVVLVTN